MEAQFTSEQQPQIPNARAALAEACKTNSHLPVDAMLSRL